jgi:hypothetical protein
MIWHENIPALRPHTFSTFLGIGWGGRPDSQLSSACQAGISESTANQKHCKH